MKGNMMAKVRGKHARITVKEPYRMSDKTFLLLMAIALPCAFGAGFWITGLSGWFG